ncbi:MAG: TAXI family TRAP transporter solute-binding subunit [Pseudomonadota bacterium]
MKSLFYQTPVTDNRQQYGCWIILLWLACFSAPLLAIPQTISIGTAGINGVYHPSGGAICRMLNKQRARHGIRCIVKNTSGSVYNLQAIRNTTLNVGLTQSDWQHYAHQGTNRFAREGEDTRLRSLFSLYAETFTLIARADSNIQTLTDIRTHRINIGSPGSGQRGTIDILLKFLDWQLSDFELVSELPSTEQVDALCDDKLDAIIVTVGHPSSFVNQIAETCAIRLIPAEHPAIDALLAEHYYYRRARIPGALYPGNPDEIATFGVGATVVSSTSTSDDVIYELVKGVFDNLDEFKSLQPALAHLEPVEMVQDSLSAPLHDGAERYYREAGIACYDSESSEHNRYCQPGTFIPANRPGQTTTDEITSANSPEVH